MKVAIKDFQIIKSASLEFNPGLTVILGESNNGKTALFRAIKSCIYNEPGTTYVRTGCKNYVIGIEENNHKVLLQKGENSLYMIDGQQFNKIGKTQLTEVANAIGISALNINGNTEKINFWDQMEKPFLLDRNSSELFRFIVDSGEDDNLNVTLRAMVSDKNKLNLEKNLKEGSLTEIKTQLNDERALLAGSEEKIALCENITAFGPKVSRLTNINATITSITNTNNTIANKTKEITEKRETINKLNEKLNKLSFMISSTAQAEQKVKECNSVQTTIDELSNKLNNKIDYSSKLATLNKLIDLHSKTASKVLLAVDTKSKISSYNKTKIKVSLTQQVVNSYNTSKQLVTRIKQLKCILDSLTEKKKQLDATYEEVLHQYNSVDTCPYCGNKLRKEETNAN